MAACSKGGAKADTWKVAGVDVPVALVPKTVDFPTTGFNQKLGDKIDTAMLAAMEHAAPGVRLYYNGYPNVEAYVVRFESDPIPDLTKAWGAPASNDTSGPGVMIGTEQRPCWDNPAKKVRACVEKLRDKTFFDLVTAPM
jgi:hypothetical protein